MTPYTISDYLNAILRELAKRQTAYPKIIEKMRKGGATNEDIIAATTEQRIQYELLQEAENYLSVIRPTDGISEAIWRELLRELRMRKKCYPRWVAFRRMDADTAEREIHIWQALTDHFHETYCPDAPLRARRT